MLFRSPVVRQRAMRVLDALLSANVDCAIVDSVSSVGAGAFPRASLPSVAIALGGNAERWAAMLRDGDPAVVGRVKDGRLLLDLRAIADDEVDALVSVVRGARD